MPKGSPTTSIPSSRPRTSCQSTLRPTRPSGTTSHNGDGRAGTWPTSSLTPQIAGRWEDDPDLFSRVWPMDLRPQAHDIIRTWLFATVVRSHLEVARLPWGDAALSG